MKLTTKMLISLGLTFILGMQAFASEIFSASVVIINKDCPSSFFIHGCSLDPKKPRDDCKSYIDYRTVPIGPASDPITHTLDTPQGGRVSVCPDTNDIIGCVLDKYLYPNTTLTVTFQLGKVIKLCFPISTKVTPSKK